MKKYYQKKADKRKDMNTSIPKKGKSDSENNTNEVYLFK